MPGTERTHCCLLLFHYRNLVARPQRPAVDFAAQEDSSSPALLPDGSPSPADTRPLTHALRARRQASSRDATGVKAPYDGHPRRSRPGQCCGYGRPDTADRRLGRAESSASPAAHKDAGKRIGLHGCFDRSMLLCLSMARRTLVATISGVAGGGVPTGLLLGFGQDREGPLGVEGKLLLGHAQQVGELRPGTAGESLAGQQVRQPIRGSGRPRGWCVSQRACAGAGRPRGRRSV